MKKYIKFIENKIGSRRVKTKERRRKYNDKIERRREIKGQKGRGKVGKKCNHRCKLIGRSFFKYIYIYQVFFFFLVGPIPE